MFLSCEKIKTMLEKLFLKEKLNIRNLIIIAIYTIVSFFLYVYFEVTKKPETSLLFGYSFITHFWLIGFDYRALRKLNYFCFWLLVGIIQFVIYLNIKDNPTYALVNGHAANGFRTTLILLIGFQFVRLLSFEIQGVDFVMPQKSGKMDMFNEREFTNVDIVLSFLLFGIIPFLYFF